MKKLYAWLCLRWRMVIQPSVSKGAGKLRPARKIWFDLFLAMFFLFLFASHLHLNFSSEIQLLQMKATQINVGMVHAFIANMLLFGWVNWNEQDRFTPQNVGWLVLIYSFTHNYAVGG